LSWYGVEWNEDDSRDDLEDCLWDVMSTRPPPELANAIYEIEAGMRQRWSDASVAEQVRYVSCSYLIALSDVCVLIAISLVLSSISGHKAIQKILVTYCPSSLALHP
jgi:hypothetical protein